MPIYMFLISKNFVFYRKTFYNIPFYTGHHIFNDKLWLDQTFSKALNASERQTDPPPDQPIHPDNRSGVSAGLWKPSSGG